MKMEDDNILSDLCSSCHLQKPKYKCPRCFSRTCSLKCAKLHKERAQCSGARDPTAFVKKSQLVSPAGFDHDYNFLSGFERRLATQRDEVQAKFSEAQHTPDLGQREKRGEQYRRRIRDLGVTVINAPTGMARQRENQSRLGRKSHEVIWSTEWVLEDGRRCVTNVLNNSPIQVAFRTAAGILNVPLAQLTCKKRKRDVAYHMHPAEGQILEQSDATNVKDNDEHIGTAIVEAGLGSKVPESSRHTAYNNGDKILEGNSAKDAIDPAAPTSSGREDESASRDESRKAADDTHTPALYFYLVKARKTKAQTALTPIDPLHSLKDILNGQIVLEFPTIQILNHAPDSLPVSFLLDEDGEEIVVKQTGLAHSSSVEDEMENAEEVGAHGGRLPNGADLMAISQRDIL